MATRKPTGNDATLPFSALQLLAPPIRLVSAAVWKVMKQRDVMQYGILEEFVSSACETVPELLTFRHQGKLTLGLRGRLILELCRGQEPPDLNSLSPHLERIRAPSPAPSSSSSQHKPKKDLKIEKTINHFHKFVRILLRDPTEREHFFKEQFPIEYGQKFDHELEKLLWEFLIRLDKLLPVPNLAQTVSWLSCAPPVLEECARAATQPQLLNILLQHQICLGHLETAASLPPGLGDSILTSLSLPPSGNVPSNQSSGSEAQSVGEPDVSSPAPETSQAETRDQTVLIKPVIRQISSEDVPVMISTNTTKSRSDLLANSQDSTDEELEMPGSSKFTRVKPRQDSRQEEMSEHDEQLITESVTPNRGQVTKYKQTERKESESEEEEMIMTNINRKKRRKRHVSSDRESDSENNGTHSPQMDLEGLQLPENLALSPILMSCLYRQPRVLISRLTPSQVCNNVESTEEDLQLQDNTRELPDTPVIRRNIRVNLRRLELELPSLDDKENHLVLPGQRSSSLQGRDAETFSKPRDGEDFIGDSEDEATKNFKSRLFVKRYFKTKHNTYVPTLREFLKPWMVRRNLLLPEKRRRCLQRGKAKQTNSQTNNV
ncbi:TERF1-interacting nuclear factor 2 [Lampris incognitus]|uniref:TERF1-interacting nuclear factor 2 n=1 Tax=Lampris incognitus TaxID=2546036 RepID=UPI0024B6078C|nr:TERF1-interacting nuclear factor 2 [Lampris incognitus]